MMIKRMDIYSEQTNSPLIYTVCECTSIEEGWNQNGCQFVQFPLEIIVTLEYQDGVCEKYSGLTGKIVLPLDLKNGLLTLSGTIDGNNKQFVANGIKFSLAEVYYNNETSLLMEAYKLRANM